MTVWINGERREVAASTDLATLLTGHGVPERGVAVAIDGAVVPRASWADTPVAAESRIEILTAVQGG